MCRCKPMIGSHSGTDSASGPHRNRIVMEAEATAEAIQVKGDAEAYAIEAKAKAEAEQMAKKADAWKDYQDAAMVDMILETLPKVSRHVEYNRASSSVDN